jgi:uncharacterized protein YlzI (FlbEa/FlbD family)
LAIITIGIIACDNGGGTTHTHEWEWVVTKPATPDADGVETETCKTCGQTNGTRPIPKITCKCPEGTTHEPNEKCCEGKDCTCSIAEPTVKTFNDKVMFTHATNGDPYYANFVDARTKAGSKTLEQLDINVVEQLQRVVSAAYTASGNAAKGRFVSVFTERWEDNIYGRVVITIENNVDYASYETDNQKSVRFNIDYLLDENTTDAVLQAAITTMVTEMNGKPLPPLPWLDENGVPYYGTLPNTTIKIYKGDATVTDEQMTDAVAKIQGTGNLGDDSLFTAFKDIIDSIRVTTGTEVIRKENIVDVGCDATDGEIGTQFVLIALGVG